MHLAHINDHNDKLVEVSPLVELVYDWRSFLWEEVSNDKTRDLRRHERSGRPLGKDIFIEQIEKLSGRILQRQKPGPKGKINKR